MEIVALIASITALINSLWMYKKFSGPIAIEFIFPEIEVPAPPVVQDEPAVEPEPVKKDDQSHSAWKNQTGIPLNEKKYSPSLGNRPPAPGPLERPAGFSR